MDVDEDTEKGSTEKGSTTTSLACVSVVALCLALVSMLAVAATGSLPGVVFLQPDEQLHMRGLADTTVKDGPGTAFYTPGVTRATKRKGIHLAESHWAVVTNSLTAEEKSITGPQLYFLKAHEEAGAIKPKIVLEKNEYIRLRDAKSGNLRQVQGPAIVVPSPQETSITTEPQRAMKLSDLDHVIVTDKLSGAERLVKGPLLLFPETAYEIIGQASQATKLSELDYVIVTDKLSGSKRVVKGPLLLFPETAYEIIGQAGQATKLSELDYVIVTDKISGSKRVVKGPTLLFPSTPHEVIGSAGHAFELKRHQYVRLLDQATGAMRVERGEAIVFPGAHEQPADGGSPVRDAVNVDDETAVLVRSLQTGQQRLVTEKGLFFPGPLEDIVKVQQLVRVEPHEVAIVRDNKGAFTFHAGGNGSGGDESGTAFHIPPFSELVTMYWSSGTSKEDAENHIVRNAKQVAFKVPVQKIDLRPQYAFFEYKVRTSDNVELLLEGTIFWSVQDVPRMIERTGDPKGDVWYHARSALIQAVSSVTLEQFMASFNTIVARAAATDAIFYEERGVRLHSLEVTRYECADAKTASVLQEIIQETTNRINRMQKQRSDNEVEETELTAKIALEKQRSALIEAQTANEKLQASVQGEAEGTRLAQNTLAFLNQLNTSVPDADERLALLRFFSEQATLTKQTEHLATGKASLFLTPQDVNLKIQAPSAPSAKQS